MLVTIRLKFVFSRSVTNEIEKHKAIKLIFKMTCHDGKWHNYVCYMTSLRFWNLNSTTRTIWCVFLAVHNYKFTSFPWSSYFLVPSILVVTIFGILSLVILSVCSYHLNLNDFIYFAMSGPCNVSSISLFVVVVLQFLLPLWCRRVFLESPFRILCKHSFFLKSLSRLLPRIVGCVVWTFYKFII